MTYDLVVVASILTAPGMRHRLHVIVDDDWQLVAVACALRDDQRGE